ncbi:MAG: hypothetical protein SGCHY_005073, partial [Lobulomycetales sp.]
MHSFVTLALAATAVSAAAVNETTSVYGTYSTGATLPTAATRCATQERLQPTACSGETVPVIKGDTLSQFSEQNGLDLQKIKNANMQFDADFDLICPGDGVCIPSDCSYPNRAVADETMCESVNTVEPKCSGMTLSEYAEYSNRSAEAIADYNKQIGGDYVWAGDKICTPVGCPSYGKPFSGNNTASDHVAAPVAEEPKPIYD